MWFPACKAVGKSNDQSWHFCSPNTCFWFCFAVKCLIMCVSAAVWLVVSEWWCCCWSACARCGGQLVALHAHPAAAVKGQSRQSVPQRLLPRLRGHEPVCRAWQPSSGATAGSAASQWVCLSLAANSNEQKHRSLLRDLDFMMNRQTSVYLLLQHVLLQTSGQKPS